MEMTITQCRDGEITFSLTKALKRALSLTFRACIVDIWLWWWKSEWTRTGGLEKWLWWLAWGEEAHTECSGRNGKFLAGSYPGLSQKLWKCACETKDSISDSSRLQKVLSLRAFRFCRGFYDLHPGESKPPVPEYEQLDRSPHWETQWIRNGCHYSERCSIPTPPMSLSWL